MLRLRLVCMIFVDRETRRGNSNSWYMTEIYSSHER
jgi:hypothetical protein